MSKFGTIEFSGKSGKLYSFNVYTLDNDFQSYSAVYCVTRRSNTENGYGTHEKLYLGSTSDISTEITGHQASSCFESNDANCVCTHREESEHARGEILKDLVDHYSPPCN